MPTPSNLWFEALIDTCHSHNLAIAASHLVRNPNLVAQDFPDAGGLLPDNDRIDWAIFSPKGEKTPAKTIEENIQFQAPPKIKCAHLDGRYRAWPLLAAFGSIRF